MADPKNSAQALSQLQKVQKTSLNPNDILGQQRQQLGVDAAQDTVTGLRGAINNTTKLLSKVAPSVMGRTGSSLVTNAQATRQIANEQAPISQNLTEQGRDYSFASEDLGRLQGRASEAASGIYQGQQDKLSYLQNVYNTLFGREESSAARKAEKRAFNESKRQFNLSLEEQKAARKAAGSGGGSGMGGLLDSLFGGGGGASSPKAQMKQRKGGGFNFVSPSGKAVTAAAYAKASNIPFRTLLTKMAKKGDKGAKAALSFVGNDFGYDPRKISQGWQVRLYEALTGRQIPRTGAAPQGGWQ